jgi:hypothetical protein
MLNRKTMVHLFTAVLFGSLLTLAACKKKDDGGGEGAGTVATTPCASTCNNTVYSTLPGLITPTAYTYGANGFCGCAYGTRPIYNYEWGFACVPASTLTYSSYWGYNTGSIYQPQNFVPTNMQQVSYNPLQYGGDTNNCFHGVAASCDVRVANTCGGGATCRPIGGGSTVGVCTSAVGGVDAYNSGSTYDPYNNHYYNGYYNGGGYNHGGYNHGNCSYRRNSWGLMYYKCGF